MPTLWIGTSLTALDSLGGARNSGRAINNLNDLLDGELVAAGWRLVNAVAINDAGWITGIARNDITGVQAGFLMRVGMIR